MDQIESYMDQNLIWLIVNRKQLQFWKSKILFSCYTPLNSEQRTFFSHPVHCQKCEILCSRVELLGISSLYGSD